MIRDYEKTKTGTTRREKVKVRAQELTIGMYVCELDRPWLDSPFLIQGFLLTTAQQVRQVQEVCQYVYIDAMEERVYDASGKPALRKQYVQKVPFEKAVARACDVRDHALEITQQLYNSIRLGDAFNVDAAKAVATQCVDAIVNNADAMLWLQLLSQKAHKLAEHGLSTCIFSILLGREEGLLEEELKTLGLCGLLHDIGQLRINTDTLYKRGDLNRSDINTLKRHPQLGKNLLMSKSGIPPAVVDVVYSHHERLNGQGYPRGLSAYQIPYFAKIIAIADTYDALTANLNYNKTTSSLEALRVLSAARNKEFDDKLVIRFVKLIGIYPIGSLAELSSGEVGIVLPTAEAFKLKPRLLMVRNRDKQPCEERLLDLSTEPLDDAGVPLKIRQLLPDGSLDIEAEAYRQHPLIIAP